MEPDKEFNGSAKKDLDAFNANAFEHAQNLLIEWSENREGELSRMAGDPQTLEKVFGSALAISAYIKATHENNPNLSDRQSAVNLLELAFTSSEKNFKEIMPDYIEVPNYEPIPGA